MSSIERTPSQASSLRHEVPFRTPKNSVANSTVVARRHYASRYAVDKSWTSGSTPMPSQNSHVPRRKPKDRRKRADTSNSDIYERFIIAHSKKNTDRLCQCPCGNYEYCCSYQSRSRDDWWPICIVKYIKQKETAHTLVFPLTPILESPLAQSWHWLYVLA